MSDIFVASYILQTKCSNLKKEEAVKDQSNDESVYEEALADISERFFPRKLLRTQGDQSHANNEGD